MAGFPALFCGGPANMEFLTVFADSESCEEASSRPASWQEFRKEILNRHGLSTGRIGVFRYHLRAKTPEGLWTYIYSHYGESHVDVFSAEEPEQAFDIGAVD